VIDCGDDFHRGGRGKGDRDRDGAVVVVVAHAQTPLCPLDLVAGVVVGRQGTSVASDDSFDVGCCPGEGDFDQAGFVGRFGDAGDGAYLGIRQAPLPHLFRDQRRDRQSVGDAELLACGARIEPELPCHPGHTRVTLPLLPTQPAIELGEQREPAVLGRSEVCRPRAQLGLQTLQWHIGQGGWIVGDGRPVADK